MEIEVEEALPVTSKKQREVRVTSGKLGNRADLITKPGRHGDGGNLFLVVSPNGSKRWVFLYRSKHAGKRTGKAAANKLREMGLGSFETMSLKEARLVAQQHRKLLAEGKDPIEVKRHEAAIPTFAELASKVIEIKEGEYRNDKSTARIKRALEVHAAKLGPFRVDEIDTQHVLNIIEPMWRTKPKTARDVRSYIEVVLRRAISLKYRTGPNPAAGRGHLNDLLGKQSKSKNKRHYAALPYEQMPTFMAEVRANKLVNARALEFGILTAARPGEVLNAQWSEISFSKRLWTIPGDKMKKEAEHTVPLSDRAIAILEGLKPGEGVATGSVFTGKKGRPVTDMAVNMLVRRMNMPKVRWVDPKQDNRSVTVHGTSRSTFRDWAGDCTDYAREVIEAALAHDVGTDSERSYRRGDATEKRRALMVEWAAYCATPVSAAAGAEARAA